MTIVGCDLHTRKQRSPSFMPTRAKSWRGAPPRGRCRGEFTARAPPVIVGIEIPATPCVFTN